MKFRLKLMILLLVISIIPIVSLRTFGIQNVRLMGEALISQVNGKQINDARHRLQLVLNEYAKVIRTSRKQAEMALFYQTFEVRRTLQTQFGRPSDLGIHPASPQKSRKLYSRFSGFFNIAHIRGCPCIFTNGYQTSGAAIRCR